MKKLIAWLAKKQILAAYESGYRFGLTQIPKTSKGITFERVKGYDSIFWNVPDNQLHPIIEKQLEEIYKKKGWIGGLDTDYRRW